MRILFAGHSLADPQGGGELSMRCLLEALSERHEIEAIGLGTTDRIDRLGHGLSCTTHRRPSRRLPFHLDAMLAENQLRGHLTEALRAKPDLVLLQQPAHLRRSDFDAHSKSRFVLFIRSLLCFGVANAPPGRVSRLAALPFQRVRLARNRPLLERADLILSNSEFLQGVLRQRSGLATEVVPPFIDLAAARTKGSRAEATALTFVGLDLWKGARIALELARRLPALPFLFLTGARSSRREREAAMALGNVTVMPWTEDMRPVFARTRILLMPSLWEEPFGRLPVEAGASGIPTIASRRGGLPESVGQGGILIDPPRDLAAWIAAIREFDDPERYARASNAARENASKFALDRSVARFESLLRTRLSLPI